MRVLIPFAVALALTLAAGVSALAQQASSLLCAVINVVECSAQGECQRSTIESANLPRFIRVNPAARSLASTGDDARTAPIQSVERVNDRLILQGGQQGRAWSATVADKTGQMSVAVVEDQTAFVVFGACTAAEPERR
ncbi:MAG: hypothetical protein DME11_22890 [Candidatus Rokuibacteriota bacterium]|nr:MAG: hypothetical protein DMD80_16255 [Candidatus Rokubacteria bacterium]PYM61565.1 MAG: hypothetical protein DME11_22890 [Candidatus Rokubacteria bacterium]